MAKKPAKPSHHTKKRGNSATVATVTEIVAKPQNQEPATVTGIVAKPQNQKSIWPNILKALKEQKNPMLLSTLRNTKGQIIDDQTFGIKFENGINSFDKTIIEQSENMQELKRLISIECKKDMRIKLIDAKQAQEKTTKQIEKSPLETLNGLNINIIE